jgi:hypothetical protein
VPRGRRRSRARAAGLHHLHRSQACQEVIFTAQSWQCLATYLARQIIPQFQFGCIPVATNRKILTNRQSAQGSRVRKLQYISELERSATSLQVRDRITHPASVVSS